MAGSISGKVTSSSGSGMPNLTVQATGGGRPVSATTNSSGNYQIPGAGTFTPPTFSVTLAQNQNVTGRNFTQS
jgi:hypothetical protein